MNMALTRASEIYSKIDNPMSAVVELGKMFHQSQIMNISTPGDGAVLALTCMCEGITPLEFAKTYHIINGRPSMRADMMAAKFRGAGGKVKWVNLGDDGKAAEAEFTFDGQSLPIKYTIEDAKAVVGDKLDKPDSNWRKDRGAMLRARLVTKAIRILAPELIAGVYTPEELEDSGVAPTADAKPAKKSQADRRKELEAEQATTATVVDSSPPAAVHTPAAEEIIDVTPEPAQETPVAQTETAPFPTESDDSNEPVTNELLQEIVKIGAKIPSPSGSGKGMDLKEISEGICRACSNEQRAVTKPQEATRGQVRKLIARWRTALGEKS